MLSSRPHAVPECNVKKRGARSDVSEDAGKRGSRWKKKGVKGEKGPVEGTKRWNGSMVEGLKWDRQRQGLAARAAKAQSVVAWPTGINACKSDRVELFGLFFFLFFFLAIPLYTKASQIVLSQRILFANGANIRRWHGGVPLEAQRSTKLARGT